MSECTNIHLKVIKLFRGDEILRGKLQYNVCSNMCTGSMMMELDISFPMNFDIRSNLGGPSHIMVDINDLIAKSIEVPIDQNQTKK